MTVSAAASPCGGGPGALVAAFFCHRDRGAASRYRNRVRGHARFRRGVSLDARLPRPSREPCGRNGAVEHGNRRA